MKLKAEKRELLGKKTKNIRKMGKVPGSVFGPKRESLSLQVDTKDLIAMYKKVGSNKFFDLEIEGETKPSKVLIKEIVRHPVKDTYMDVSFYQVAEDRKLNVEVPVVVLGESPAVKANLGFLINQFNSLTVHCLPKDLPASIEIDISDLNEPGDSIQLSSIVLPEGVEWDSGLDTSSAIVYIASFQKEEAVEEVSVADGEDGTETTDATSSAEAKAE